MRYRLIPYLVVALGIISGEHVFAATVGDPARGRVLAEACESCHGLDGQTQIDGFPILAGQKVKYMVKQLREMRESAKIRAGLKLGADRTKAITRARRSNELMDEYVVELSDQDIADVSSYYAEQPCRILMSGAPLPAPKIEVRCRICHGKRGIAKKSNIPNIAGQNYTYLEQQMLNFKEGGTKNKQTVSEGEIRRSAIMEGQVKHLSVEDIQKISRYYSTLPCSK